MVERGPEKAGVGGSIPSLATTPHLGKSDSVLVSDVVACFCGLNGLKGLNPAFAIPSISAFLDWIANSRRSLSNLIPNVGLLQLGEP